MRAPLTSGVYYGRTSSTRNISGLILTESHYRTDTVIPRHCHDNGFFYLVVDGICRENSQGRDVIAEPGALVFHPALEPHANHWVGSEGKCFHVELGETWIERLLTCRSILDRPVHHPGGQVPWLAKRMYNEFQVADEASSLTIEGITLELLGAFVRNTREVVESMPPRWLERVRQLLHDSFADNDNLGLESIARTASVHPAHVVRSFRRHYGCTMGEYVRNLRIEYACRQLMTSDTPVIEVALSAGFSDQSHFSKTFKRRMGMTPGEFKKNRLGCKPETKS